MADAKKVSKKPCSAKRLAANRANGRLSRGPSSIEGAGGHQ